MKSFFAIKKNILYIVRKIFRDKQIYQQDILKYLKDIKNPIILEAGAADGYDTFRFSKLSPSATIYAFEPVRKNFKILMERMKSCTNVKLYNFALADFDGMAEMNISKNSNQIEGAAASSSLLEPEFHTTLYPNIVFDEKEKVEARTLDSWALKEGVDHIDAMWLDMQGYEYPMLKESKIILPTVRVIYSEVSIKKVFKGACMFDEYKEWLLSLGFFVVMEEIVDEGTGNVLFVRSKT